MITIPLSYKLSSSILLIISVLLLSVVFGIGIAVIGAKFALVAIAITLAPILILIPIEHVLWVLLVSTFIISGTLQYFGGIHKAFWLPYLLGLLILVRLPLDIRKLKLKENEYGKSTGIPLPVASYFLFIFIAIVSVIINFVPVAQVLVSFKEYVGVLGVFLPLAAGLVSPIFFDRVWIFFMWLVPIQLPAVLYQHFVIAPSRRGGASWDAVVGTFGGNPEGGGASGAMAIFVLIVSLIAISKWRQGDLHTRYIFIVGISAILCIGLAEVKFALLLIPIAAILLFRQELLKRPIKSLSMILCAIVLTFGLLVAYKTQFTYGGRGEGGKSIAAYVEKMFTHNFDEGFFNRKTREIGRVASIKFWWHENPLSDPLKFFLGHGIGATKVGETMVGEAARRYTYRIDRSAVAIFLWEIGVFGLLAILTLLWSTIVAAHKLEKAQNLPAENRGVMSTVLVALVIVIAELPYHTDLANVPQWQLLVVILLGYVTSTGRLLASQLTGHNKTELQMVPASELNYACKRG